MSRRPASKRDPRQRAGLALATPRRVRFSVPANEWAAIHDRDRALVAKPWGVALTWHPRTTPDGAVPLAWLSSPVEWAVEHRVHEVLHGVGLEVTRHDALCWAHLVRVRYPDGATMVFGLSVPARDVAHAEADGYPVASVDLSRRVRPWYGCAHGHTDAEVLASVEFVRPRAVVEALAAGAGR